jgi:hypothetical protein
MDKMVLAIVGLIVILCGMVAFFCDLAQQGLMLMLIGTIISVLGVPQNEDSNNVTTNDPNDKDKSNS